MEGMMPDADEFGDDDIQCDIGPVAVAILHQMGYRAKLTEMADAQFVHSSAGGHPFVISHVPIADIDCESYSFTARFPKRTPLEQLNGWNASGNVARAYIDERDETVLSLNFLNEGLTKACFAAHLMQYVSEVERFGVIVNSAR
jgi:hypothetical protein